MHKLVFSINAVRTYGLEHKKTKKKERVMNINDFIDLRCPLFVKHSNS